MQISKNNYLSLKSLQSLQATQRSKPSEAPTLFDITSQTEGKKKIEVSGPAVDSERSSQLRAGNTRGLGNRVVGASAIESDLAVSERYPGLEPSEDNLAFYSATDDAPSTEDLRQLRGAIEDVANRFLRNSPNASLDEIKTELDDNFGSGFSETIGIDQIDLGNGESELRIQQIDFQDLDIEEKNIINRAVNLSQDNFSSSDFTRELSGADIDDQLNKLELNLGITSKPFVADLRNQLQNSVVDKSLSGFEEIFKDSKSVINNLKKLDEKNIDSFSRKPFMDDLHIRFASGRYGSARSADDIETVSLLTTD